MSGIFRTIRIVCVFCVCVRVIVLSQVLQLCNTSMELVRYNDTLLRMEIANFSMGPNADSAYQLAAILPEGVKYDARNLNINNKIQLKPGTPFRGQQRHIRLSIPNNSIVITDRNAASLQREDHAAWRD